MELPTRAFAKESKGMGQPGTHEKPLTDTQHDLNKNIWLTGSMMKKAATATQDVSINIDP